ncbi:hypothetical protein [Streptomyces mexicanus]|uniref:hypothetical protein n=1 Tax=Streptomyces mexicanus TaxID=178566 RepID=UPI0031E88027
MHSPFSLCFCLGVCGDGGLDVAGEVAPGAPGGLVGCGLLLSLHASRVGGPRWGLSVDAGGQTALAQTLGQCPDRHVTVTPAR